MFSEAKNHLDAAVLPLSSAVFCMDCEVISSSRSDECAVCKSRALLSLDRILGGSLLAHRVERERESGLFHITVAIELQQMPAKDWRATVERLTSVIGANLSRDRAAFRINVNPAVDALDLQTSACSTEREAA
jgi:hypothetical protein